ncbi:MAG TPA: DUF6647 family protein [Burkholderiales bacterium]|nr:DUF6647 family protein [Burkholderiales bacterium]
MDLSVLADTVVRLYAAIHMMMGYPLPEPYPLVRSMSRAAISEIVCTRPCQIRAFYHPDLGVVVDEALNLQSSAYDRSILLHELVHHAQHAAGAFREIDSACVARSKAEMEAYTVQNRYLRQSGASEAIPVLNWRGLCRRSE